MFYWAVSYASLKEQLLEQEEEEMRKEKITREMRSSARAK